jgi:DNA/RNA endonuclease YhcR with UshA esterase domain
MLFHPARATTICEIQQYDASGFSPLEGQRVTVTGVVTVPAGFFVPAYTSIFIRGLGADSCGINVFAFDPISRLSLGDTITVTGTVLEYAGTAGATTEVAELTGEIIVKDSDVFPEPTFMSTGSVGQEKHEGMFVRVKGRVVDKDGLESIFLDDGTGPIEIHDRAGTFTTNAAWQELFFGDEVTATGVVSQYDPSPPYLSNYSIWPRSPDPPYDDIVGPRCIPDTSTSRVLLEITDANGDRVNIFCPECPRPYNKVNIRFNGPHGGRARLRIFDTSGRCVATLEDRITECGEASFEWNGRNELLERLPMGLYHVIATATDPETGAETEETVPIVIGRRLK